MLYKVANDIMSGRPAPAQGSTPPIKQDSSGARQDNVQTTSPTSFSSRAPLDITGGSSGGGYSFNFTGNNTADKVKSYLTGGGNPGSLTLGNMGSSSVLHPSTFSSSFKRPVAPNLTSVRSDQQSSTQQSAQTPQTTQAPQSTQTSQPAQQAQAPKSVEQTYAELPRTSSGKIDMDKLNADERQHMQDFNKRMADHREQYSQYYSGPEYEQAKKQIQTPEFNKARQDRLKPYEDEAYHADQAYESAKNVQGILNEFKERDAMADKYIKDSNGDIYRAAMSIDRAAKADPNNKNLQFAASQVRNKMNEAAKKDPSKFRRYAGDFGTGVLDLADTDIRDKYYSDKYTSNLGPTKGSAEEWRSELFNRSDINDKLEQIRSKHGGEIYRSAWRELNKLTGVGNKDFDTQFHSDGFDRAAIEQQVNETLDRYVQ